MNAIRQTQQLNKRELENAIPPSASWHADYRDTAWVYVGGIPLDLSEGDVITIFSQFGNPTHLNLIRDRKTGKSKGFGFLKYEDQRSCDLAVDNLTGADVLGRMLRVDHTRYKKRDDENEDTWRIDRLEAEALGEGSGKRASDTEESNEESKRRKRRRSILKEEKELERMLAIKENGEDKDPMKDYLIKEKREEVQRARIKEADRDRKHKHRHRQKDDGEEQRRAHRDRRREDREDNDTVRRNRKDQRRRQESVDSDGDTIRKTSYRDGERDVRARAVDHNHDKHDGRSKKSRRGSGASNSSPERRTSSRREEDRSRRRRSRSRDRPSSKRHYSSAEEDYGKRSSGHRRRRSEDS